MIRLAAMLRAVNVGDRKLLMADLVRIATALGFESPSTLLASGNLLFQTEMAPDEAGRRLGAAILADQGLATDVLVRDGATLAAVIAGNPFPEQARTAPGALGVVFLDRAPEGQVADLASACELGETVQAGAGCLYLWYPKGMGVSKLTTAVIERRLRVRGTVRNWTTVGKLAARMAALDPGVRP